MDRLILLDIYPAREEPIPGVTSEIIFRNVTAAEKLLMGKEELMEYLEEKMEYCGKDVLITMGAGDIDRFVPQIRNMLHNKGLC